MTRQDAAKVAYGRAVDAARTLQEVSPLEIVTDGVAESALAALEDSRDAILALQVMVKADVQDLPGLEIPEIYSAEVS